MAAPITDNIDTDEFESDGTLDDLTFEDCLGAPEYQPDPEYVAKGEASLAAARQITISGRAYESKAYNYDPISKFDASRHIGLPDHVLADALRMDAPKKLALKNSSKTRGRKTNIKREDEITKYEGKTLREEVASLLGRMSDPTAFAEEVFESRVEGFSQMDDPQLMVQNIIVPKVNNAWTTLAAVWPSQLYSKRAFAIQTTDIGGGTMVGNAFLAWNAIGYDLEMASRGGQSIFTTAASSYRRAFYAITPRVIDNVSYAWESVPFSSLGYTTSLGPNPNLSFSWPTGAETNGMADLHNAPVALTEEQIIQFGVPAAMEMFNMIIPAGTKLVPMVTPYKPVMNTGAAFAQLILDGDAFFPKAARYVSETKIESKHEDLAQLGLAQVQLGVRDGPFQGAVVAGIHTFYVKCLYPKYFNNFIRVTPKEINFTSILTQAVTALALGDTRYCSLLNIVTLGAQPLESLLLSITAGQFNHSVLSIICAKYAVSGGIMALSGSINGSAFVLGGGARFYTAPSVYNTNTFSWVNEELADLSVMPGAHNPRSSRKAGYEIMLPYVAMNAPKTNANPIDNTGPSFSVESALRAAIPSIADPSPYVFHAAGTLPDQLDLSVTTLMQCYGTGVELGIRQYNAVVNQMQGNVRSDSIGNVHRPSTTIYWTYLLDGAEPIQQYDTTSRAIVSKVTNRFPWSSNLIREQWCLVPIAYGGVENTTYPAWMDERTSIPDLTEQFFVMLTSRATKYSHFILGGGTEQEIVGYVEVAQAEGGGFIDVIRGIGRALPVVTHVARQFFDALSVGSPVTRDMIKSPGEKSARKLRDAMKLSRYDTHNPVFRPVSSGLRFH